MRPTNEDHFLSSELTKTMRIWQTSLPGAKAQLGVDRGHLFLVADGMGGHRAGEEASALAVVAIEQFTLNTFKWFFDSNGPDAQVAEHRFRHVITNGTVRCPHPKGLFMETLRAGRNQELGSPPDDDVP